MVRILRIKIFSWNKRRVIDTRVEMLMAMEMKEEVKTSPDSVFPAEQNELKEGGEQIRPNFDLTEVLLQK
jgi:hypothetical protein